MYPQAKKYLCFFHYCQALWRRAALIGLKQQDIINVTKDMLLNLKLLSFLDPGQITDFYSKIKKEFEDFDERINSFLEYFEKTWIKHSMFGVKYWNYSKSFTDEGGEINITKKMHFTNNAVESCNNIINSLLTNGNIKRKL